MDITQFNTITISPGGTAYIPKDAIIISKTSTGNANVDSDCIDLSDIEEFSCFVLYYELAPNQTPSIPNENQDTVISGIKIMATEYTIPDIPADTISGFQDWLNSSGLSNIFQFNKFVTTNPSVDRYGKSIYFKTTASIAATVELKLTAATFNTFYVKPIASEDCL